jgi:hypothetical protein
METIMPVDPLTDQQRQNVLALISAAMVRANDLTGHDDATIAMRYREAAEWLRAEAARSDPETFGVRESDPPTPPLPCEYLPDKPAPDRRTPEEIEHLKRQWLDDPDSWDIEDAEGFEAHADELFAWRKEEQRKAAAAWEASRPHRNAVYAWGSAYPFVLNAVEHESGLSKLEATANSLFARSIGDALAVDARLIAQAARNAWEAARIFWRERPDA